LLDPADAPTVLNLLERIAGDLMSARGGRTRPALRTDLFGRGARLAVRPDYRNDIGALATYSQQTEQTLRGLEMVEAEAGVPVGITRHCQAAVNAAALGGDVLLIGEPGGGKSAVINALGRALRAQGHDVVEMAVDRFSVESLEGLSRALNLRHDLPAVLDAWDGPNPAFLLIDALDVSRGGSGEAAFKRLIESVIELGGRWTVIASIRIFDLRLGQSFRTLFEGTPPDKALQGEGFAAVRHVGGLIADVGDEASLFGFALFHPRTGGLSWTMSTQVVELDQVVGQARTASGRVYALGRRITSVDLDDEGRVALSLLLAKWTKLEPPPDQDFPWLTACKMARHLKVEAPPRHDPVAVELFLAIYHEAYVAVLDCRRRN
jgi:hypothetical protein